MSETEESLAGESLAGESLAGESLAGESLAGEIDLTPQTSSTNSFVDEERADVPSDVNGPVDADGVPGESAAHVAPDENAADESAPAADEPEADPALEDPARLAAAVEAILFVVDTPLAIASLASALRQPVAAIEAALLTLREGLDAREAGIELREAAGGVRLYTRPVHAPHVERFLQDGQRSRLSQAALETLAVIAYRQPVTRSRVSAIRGVNVDGVVRTLLSRGLIMEVGSDPESGAGLFRTSELFLERMGMQSLDELPSLAPLLPDIEGLEIEEL